MLLGMSATYVLGLPWSGQGSQRLPWIETVVTKLITREQTDTGTLSSVTS